MKYDWIDFYTEFANKLLPFKNDRKSLIQKIYAVYEIAGISVPKLESGDEIIDIDPFTIFGTFNKGITNANRIAVLNGIAAEFGIAANVPSNFDGIPLLNPLSAMFYGFKDNRKANDIDNLWNLFEVAIALADNDTEDNRQKFSVSYDRVQNQRGIRWNITMGLYWIRPYAFINLDSRNRWFISDAQNMPSDFAVEAEKKLKKVPDAADYLKIKDLCKKALDEGEYAYKNFPDLSYTAWVISEQVNQKKVAKKGVSDAKSKKMNDSDTIADGDVDLTNVPLYTQLPEGEDAQHYWFLNANPKIWSMASMPVGEIQNYTLYNDNGNKRRIFQNFLDAKAGDMIIGYESTPVKQVVAIFKISAKQDGKSIYFEKVEGLSSPIDYATLKACPELEKMEYFGNPQGSLFKLTKSEYDFIYDMIRDENPAQTATDSIEKYDREKFLNDVYMTERKYERLVAVLKKKKNIILQGAPGVGKTFTAKRLAYSIMGEKDDDRIEFVQFHQNYSYEDFMMGYKPVEDGFELKYGIFYKFCQKAANHPDKDYFFIIDEINRGNMSKIFGELLMLIEADYRGKKATLAYNGLGFSVPKRLHIIGMMNTADRSLAMIDYALRRRFSFFDMKPGFDSKGFIKYQEGVANDTFNTLIDRIKELNIAIAEDKSLGKGFCIGHSYFCNADECTDEWMQDVVDFDVLPMLAEYWFDNTSKLQHWENVLHGVFQ